MSDLKARLRRGGTIHSDDGNATMAEAADRIEALEEALSGTTASLVAAISLLERGEKKAAPSNTMFAVMLDDYRKAVEVARKALGDTP